MKHLLKHQKLCWSYITYKSNSFLILIMLVEALQMVSYHTDNHQQTPKLLHQRIKLFNIIYQWGIIFIVRCSLRSSSTTILIDSISKLIHLSKPYLPQGQYHLQVIIKFYLYCFHKLYSSRYEIFFCCFHNQLLIVYF